MTEYNDSLFNRWHDKLHTAIDNMNAAASNENVLIEVAAQHPLIDGTTPNNEFMARLDAAIELLNKIGSNAHIYVPGSRHSYNGIDDKISLSEAGKRYLIDKGVDKSLIYGDEMNRRYKGKDGVYNSSDECYVACCIFRDFGFGKLHSVCSPAQLMRKALSYIEFGYLPEMHSVPVDNMFHSYVDEVFLYIPRLLNDEGGLQGKSKEGERLRKLRTPR